MGERKIIMASDETWALWKERFEKHDSAALYDIDNDCPFNMLESNPGDSKAQKLPPFNQNQMRNLQGMDDFAVGELASKMLDVPPKVYVKRPTSWCMALPFAQWCTRKKHKTKLVSDIRDHLVGQNVPEAKGVFNDFGELEPA